MSKIVKINYKGISIECQSICETANNQLCKVNTILERLENGSKTLSNDQTRAIKDELIAIKDQIQLQVNHVLALAKLNESKGVVYTDFDFDRTHVNAKSPIEEAQKLRNMANDLLTTRLTELEALLSNLLADRLEKKSAEMHDRAYGVCNADGTFMQNLNKVQDRLLQQYIYLEWIKNSALSFEEMKENAIHVMNSNTNKQFEDNKVQQIKEIREEMESSGVAKEVIEQIVSIQENSAKNQIQEIRRMATDEIIGEQIRKKTLRIIKEAIQKRGFVIPKGAIKLQRDTNEVVLIAQKPHGEKAEFRISMNGKFVYDFNGYEGQACQNDIDPFMEDLEKIYGLNILSKEEISSNPDKLTTQHYQKNDTNYNRK